MISIAIVLLVLTSIIILALFIFFPEIVHGYIQDPIVFKISYQFFLITVIGSAVAYLYKLLDLKREQRRYLREVHEELLNAINQAKTVRRDLKAHLGTSDRVDVNPKALLDKEEYKVQMKLLCKAQLTIEVYAKRSTDQCLWFKGAKTLEGELNVIEKYLNNILNEYQEKLIKFGKDTYCLEICSFEELKEFISPYKEGSRFDKKFKKPARRALKEIGTIMLN